MQRRDITVLNLIKTFDNYVEDKLGEDMLHAYVSTHIHKRPQPIEEFLKEFIEEEWVRLKLVNEVKERINILSNQITLALNEFDVNTYTATNLGVTLYGHH